MSRASALARDFAARAGLEPDAAGRLALVAEEWIANVVEYGGPHGDGRVVLSLSLETQVVRLSVSDAGTPFDPRDITFEGPNLERGGGAGLALIAEFCRIAAYEWRAGRNRLVLEMPLD